MTIAPRSRVPGESLVAGRGLRHQSAADDASQLGQQVAPRVGVLALQGDVLEHLRLLDAVGAEGTQVRGVSDLEGLDGLVLPGGESTTIGWLLDRYSLAEPLRGCIADGLPVLGTCAGAILLARQALRHDGAPSEQPLLGGMDTVVRRNAFGRQVASFEADIDIAGLEAPLRAVFIRAPWFEEVGPDVECLATVSTPLGVKVVVARQGALLGSAFHPELADEPRLHRLFVETAVLRNRS